MYRGRDSSPKRIKLTKDHDSRNERENKFLLGHDVSGLSSTDTNSPARKRWSRFSPRRKSSPTNLKFPQIRNRSYSLDLSPQHQQSTSRSRRNSGSSTSKRTIDFNVTQKASSPSKAKGKKSNGKPSARRISSQKNKSSSTSVVERVIPSSAMSKWTPISEEAKSLLLNSITYPSSFVGMSTAKRKIIQQQMANVVEEVKSRLKTATAPPRTKKFRSHSNLKQDMTSLRSEFFALVNHNNGVEKKIQCYESMAKEQQEKARLHSSYKCVSATSPTKKNDSLPNKDWTSESEDAFCDYLIDFIGTTRYSLIE